MLQFLVGLEGCFVFVSCARESSQNTGLNIQELTWHPSIEHMQFLAFGGEGNDLKESKNLCGG